MFVVHPELLLDLQAEFRLPQLLEFLFHPKWKKEICNAFVDLVNMIDIINFVLRNVIFSYLIFSFQEE